MMGQLRFFDNLFYTSYYPYPYYTTRTRFYETIPTQQESGEPTPEDLKKLEKRGKKQLANTIKSNSAKKDQVEKFLAAQRARIRK